MPKHIHYTLTKIQEVTKHNRTTLKIDLLTPNLNDGLMTIESNNRADKHAVVHLQTHP